MRGKRRRLGRTTVSLQEAKVMQRNMQQVYDEHMTMTVVKPARRTGGTHLSDMVALCRPIHLCGDCLPRYKDALKMREYRGDWGFDYTGNCDGCGARWVDLTGFFPSETFYHVLSNNHGKMPDPNRSLYFL